MALDSDGASVTDPAGGARLFKIQAESISGPIQQLLLCGLVALMEYGLESEADPRICDRVTMRLISSGLRECEQQEPIRIDWAAPCIDKNNSGSDTGGLLLLLVGVGHGRCRSVRLASIGYSRRPTGRSLPREDISAVLIP